MSTIHFVGGEKGGVGKSVLARLLAQYFIDHEMAFVAFDSDRSHAALMRFYADYTTKVSADNYVSLDRIMEAAAASDQMVLVDLAAQTRESLTTWMDESDLLGLATEVGVNIRYWHVMDSGKDSVDLLRNLLDRFDVRMHYVLVLNHLRGDDFSLLRDSGLLARARELGAQAMELKRLHASTMNKIDAKSSSFWAARQSDPEAGLGLLERQRVKTWLQSGYHEIARVLA
ncbi:hypothetical protein AB4090_06030 [Acidithiobacillus sp. IBUN Pt1247-S3]|uniref:hypothetical protein n=1 Tax=Acidithiobacillus sp. IBUN Pt1247-S3 TaxID=3166642 RepID=UPI0034E5412F